MTGVTPYRTLADLARRLPALSTRAEIEAALDEAEWLYEVVPPELQEHFDAVIGALRVKLAAAAS